MTLGEFSDAVDGFGELESERRIWTIYNTRKICFNVIRPHLKEGSELREEDFMPIPELDGEIEKLRVKNLPMIKVVEDGSGD